MARTTAGALAALAVVLVLTGCASEQPERSPSMTAPTTTALPTPIPTPTVEVSVAAATPAPARTPQPPVRVVAASHGVEVPVVPVGVEQGGFMELPVDPAVAGWYRFGSDPTSTDGNVVISAHVDAPGYPIGPFSRLRELVAGDIVEVADAAGATHRYAIESVTYFPKADLPVEELFARTGTKALVLITCGGEFDATTGRYADNVVAIATPLP